MVSVHSLTQDSRNALNRSRTRKNPFFNLFVQISGRIWTVVGRGYFSHASSYRENVASAHRVLSLLHTASHYLIKTTANIVCLWQCNQARLVATWQSYSWPWAWSTFLGGNFFFHAFPRTCQKIWIIPVQKIKKNALSKVVVHIFFVSSALEIEKYRNRNHLLRASPLSTPR